MTLLFSDVTGSTQLGEQLDPEAVRGVMSRYFALATEAIERHGGTVEKYIGDAVMAVFGIPVLHEDDPIRAVRAAAELRDGVATMSPELEARTGAGLQVRIGLNTGEVVAGDATLRQQLVTGDAVNVAARLEQAARPGEILLGPLTWQLVRDGVDAEPVEPIDARGKTAPIAVHRLLGLRTGAGRPLRRFGTLMVGRDRELGTIHDAFETAVAGRTPVLVTVVGAAGIGKSRLVHEFIASTSDRATVLRGRCLPYGDGITYWPIAMAVRSASGIAEDADPDEVSARLQAFVEDMPGSVRIAHALGAVVGGADTTQPREEIAWGVRRLLDGLAGRRPCVLVVDDIQWAEPTLIDLLASIPALGRDVPILVVGVARPELWEVHPTWAEGLQDARVIRLEPLSVDAVTAMLANLAGEAALPGSIVEAMSATGDGNPLFLEELMAMLVDDGLLRRAGDAWEVTATTVSIRMPPTIQALLAARLDRLEPADRAAAQRGAVVGRVFQSAAVADLSPDDERAAVPGHLANLVASELIRPDIGEGLDAFRFRHLMVRDVAYDSLPKGVRADLHQRFAAWMMATAGTRVGLDEIVGHHLEQAFGYRRELGLGGAETAEVGATALGHLSAAAFRALDRSDLPAASGLLRRSLALVPSDDPGRAERAAELIDTLIEMGRIDDAIAELKAMSGFPGVNDDSRTRAWLDVSRLLIAYQGGNYAVDEARPIHERAIADFAAVNDFDGLCHAWMGIAQGTWWRWEAALTVEALEQARTYAREAGRRSHELSILVWLTRAYCFGPTPVERALVELDGIREAAGEDPRIGAAVLLARAHLLALTSRTDESERDLDAAIASFTELGMVTDAGRAGQAAYHWGMATGRLQDAIHRLEESDRRLESIGEEAFLSTNLACGAALRLEMGLLAEAETIARRALSISAVDDLATLVHCNLILARIEAARGNGELAIRTADEALPSIAASDFHADAGDLLRQAGEVHILAGDVRGGAELLRRSMLRYGLKGAQPFVDLIQRRLEAIGAELPADT